MFVKMILTRSINGGCLKLLRLVHQPPITNTFLIPTASYAIRHPIKFVETQDRWKEKDNVSKRWQLIYKGPMEKWLKYLSIYLTFSTTSVACAGLYYAIFEFSTATMNDPVVLGDDTVVANSGLECLVYLGAFVAFHAAIKIVLAKYVLRIYQDGDNYLAIFHGNVFNAIKKCEFQLKDFKKINSKFALSWSEARFSLGNKKAIIFENHFKTPEYFNYLLYKQSKYDPNKDED